MKLLALDFDGVIVNSLMECFHSAYLAYVTMFPDAKINCHIEFKPDNVEKIEQATKQVFLKHKQLRPFIGKAADYFIIFHIVENDWQVNTQQEFNGVIKKYKDDLPSYDKAFYAARDRIKEIDFDFWFSFTSLFKKPVEDMKKLSKDFKLAVITNNELITVKASLKKAGLEIDEKDIADNRFGKDKKVHLDYLKNKHNVSYQDIYFVDDQVYFSQQFKTLGVKCFLPTWGFNNKEQQELAKKQGITLVDENNFYEKIIHT